MNILPLNNYFYNRFDNSKYNSNTNLSVPGFGVKMSKPLNRDTVTFKASMSTLIEDAAANTNKKLLGEATVFIDMLEAIANKLKGLVSFNREYCEPNAIKTPESVVSKVQRSGTFEITDRIRGTLYCKNIYDLSILVDKILPEIEKRNYILAETAMPLKEAVLRGYRPTAEDVKRGEVSLTDLDIRLDMRNQNIKPYILPEKLKYAMGQKQPSGYEDIQLRLVKATRDKDGNIVKKKNSQLYELIILFGDKYAHAKKGESDNIYQYTRQFKELNIFKRAKSDEVIALIQDYANKIKNIFSTEITQKVYENAKSQDLFNTNKSMPIDLGEDNIKALTSYYNALELSVKNYYRKLRRSCKLRDQSSILRINQEYKEDIAKLKEIREGLTNAVEFYKNYPAKPTKAKAKKS